MALPFFNAYRGSIGMFFQGDQTLKGYWQLDGNSLDNSGNGNNGIDTAVSYSSAYSKFNGGQGGLFVRANNSRVNFYQPNYPNSYTVMAWVNFASLPTLGNWYFAVGIQSSGFGLYCYNNSGTYVIGEYHTNSAVNNEVGAKINMTPRLNYWYLMVGTWNGSICRFNLNGIELASSNWSDIQTNGGNNSNIGAWTGSNPPHNFDGFIDEVAIFSRALSPAEISQYYQWAMSQPRKTYYEVDGLLVPNTRRRLLLSI